MNHNRVVAAFLHWIAQLSQVHGCEEGVCTIRTYAQIVHAKTTHPATNSRITFCHASLCSIMDSAFKRLPRNLSGPDWTADRVFYSVFVLDADVCILASSLLVR